MLLIKKLIAILTNPAFTVISLVVLAISSPLTAKSLYSIRRKIQCQGEDCARGGISQFYTLIRNIRCWEWFN